MAPDKAKSKRPRRYSACCQHLVKNIHVCLLAEKKSSRLPISTTKVLDRLVRYTGMGRATVVRLVSDKQVVTWRNEAANLK